MKLEEFVGRAQKAQKAVDQIINQHRVSGYKRVERDAYQTIEPWVTNALSDCYRLPTYLWEPACGEGHMVRALEARSHIVFGTDITIADNQDFLTVPKEPWDRRFGIVTNPPFGRRGKLAEGFIKKAIELTAKDRGMVAMLLPADFDHASTRQYLFRLAQYTMRINLLSRPKWFAGEHTPKTNFCWHVWDWQNVHAPTVRYAGK